MSRPVFVAADASPDAVALDKLVRRWRAVEREARYSRHLDNPGALAAEAAQTAAHARRLIRQCEATQRLITEREAAR